MGYIETRNDRGKKPSGVRLITIWDILKQIQRRPWAPGCLGLITIWDILKHPLLTRNTLMSPMFNNNMGYIETSFQSATSSPYTYCLITIWDILKPTAKADHYSFDNV